MTEAILPDQGPIFLLSCIRSGSTLLRCIFDAHPDVWSPPELRIGDLCACSYHAAYWSGSAQKRTEDRENGGALEYVRRTVGELMTAGAAERGKKIWCEKSPQNWQHLPLLEKVFPDARFVWISRNCMDVVHSCLETVWLADLLPEMAAYVSREPERLPAAMARYWIDTNRKFLDCERRTKDRCHRVQYESIVANPTESLRTLFVDLGLEWSDDLLTASFDDERRDGPGDFKFRYTRNIHARSVGKGSRFRREQFPQDLLDSADELSLNLGYPPVGEGTFSASPQDQGAKTNVDADLLTLVVPALLTKAPASGMRGRLVVEVGGQFWIADLGTGTWEKALQTTESDAAILVEMDDIAAIVKGDVNSADLFAEGKLIIKGHLETATNFLSLLLSRVPALL